MGTASVSPAPALVVLAAGMGSRHGGIRPAEPVGPGGESIVDYSIYDACHAGFGRVVFVVRRANEQQFKDMAHARFGRRMPVDFVLQDMLPLPPGVQVAAGRTTPWGTTQAVLAVEQAVHGPFAVINVDDFYGADSYRMLAAHLKAGTGDYAMVGFVLRNTLSEFGAVSRALCDVDEHGYLRHVKELKNVERDRALARSIDADGAEMQLRGDETVAMNMWGFTPSIFAQLKQVFHVFLEKRGCEPKAECFLADAVNVLIQAEEARVRVMCMNEGWFGLTYGEDHALAVDRIHQMVADGHYPRRLWA